MVLSAAARSIQHTPYYVCIVNGNDSAVFRVFSPWWHWPLTLTCELELRRDFCTMHVTAKFHHPMLNTRKLSCWQTNWQTNKCHWRHPPRSTMLCRWANIPNVTKCIMDTYYWTEKPGTYFTAVNPRQLGKPVPHSLETVSHSLSLLSAYPPVVFSIYLYKMNNH